MASKNDKSNSDLKESVLMNLRSVTQSLKGGVRLSCLERDYKDLLGKPIPYRELGYQSLQAFLKDIPHVIRLTHKDGQYMAEGVADSSTAHIVSLVNRQKASKTVGRPNRKPFAQRRGGFSSRYNFRPKFSSQKYSLKNTSPEDKHSKPSQSYFKETRPKTTRPCLLPSPPEVPKTQYPSSKKYEIAPRFLKLQQKNQAENNQVSYPEPGFQNHQSPDRRAQSPDWRTQSPDRVVSENDLPDTYSNNYVIKSPRPLMSTTITIKNDRFKGVDDRLKKAISSKEYVYEYANMHSISIEYRTKSIGQKRKGFLSNLLMGDKVYQSYPDHGSTPEEAEELAATVAVKAIKENEEHLASYPETPIRNAEDVQILIDRIEEIVCEKPSGMFTNGIISEYESKFHETLPENWLLLLQQGVNVEVEEVGVQYGRVPDGVKYIVHRAKASSGSTTPSSTSELERVDHVFEDRSIPRNIVRKDHLPDIPKLTVPAGNEWAVYIVDVSKTIAARLINFDGEFLDISERMKAFYASEYLPAIEISEGLLYAVRDDKDKDLFHRVLVQDIQENLVKCYFVDEGVFLNVSKSDLQELNSDFWNLPYQAIHMQLDGFADYPLTSNDLGCLLGNIFIAQVKRGLDTVSDYFPKDPAVHKIIYSVYLYDTSSEDDMDMNELIKENVIESLVAQLPQSTISASGYYLTHVENSGEIYLRNSSPVESWLEMSLENMSLDFEDACLRSVTIAHDKICVAKFEDGKWYRAVLVQNSSACKDPDKIEVFFVDYGNTSIVSVKEICELEPYSNFLSRISPQAIKCELFEPLPTPDSEWTTRAITKLFELAPVSEELLIRVMMEATEYSLAKVNLYKRTFKDGDSFIISVNESLANKPELFESLRNPSFRLDFNNIRPPVPRVASSNLNSINNVDENILMPIKPPTPPNGLNWAITPDNIRSPDALEDQNLPPLQLPEVPEISDQFDVYVTMAAHPKNFVVLPHKNIKAISSLMDQMQHFYSSEENVIEMHSSLLKQNNFYAAKHTDKNWYRVQVQSIIDNSHILVKFVDFGDLTTVSVSNLQNLYSRFRHLPCQAIQASLFGVKPISGDWDPMHCVEFQAWVKDKKFVSMVKNKHFNHDRDIVLELMLIDVSDPRDDLYIHELLIKQGKAAPV